MAFEAARAARWRPAGGAAPDLLAPRHRRPRRTSTRPTPRSCTPPSACRRRAGRGTPAPRCGRRSGPCGWRSSAPGTTLVTAADIRAGLPGGAEEATGGDAAAALLVSGRIDVPGDRRVPRRRNRGGRVHRPLAPARAQATVAHVGGALRRRPVRRRRAAGVEAALDLRRRSASPSRSTTSSSPGTHARARAARRQGSSPPSPPPADDLAATDRQPRRRPAGAAADRRARGGRRPGEVIALVVLADGADVLLFRSDRPRQRRGRAARTVADQVAAGGDGRLRPLPHLAGAAWRPSRRTGPSRPGCRRRRRRATRSGSSASSPTTGRRPRRRPRPRRHLHRRQAGVVAEPAGGLRRRRLRRRRARCRSS